MIKLISRMVLGFLFLTNNVEAEVAISRPEPTACFKGDGQGKYDIGHPVLTHNEMNCEMVGGKTKKGLNRVMDNSINVIMSQRAVEPQIKVRDDYYSGN